MQPIFVDESGDLGFGCGTRFFILAFVAPVVGKRLSKAMKNFNAHMIKNGWNKAVEIKATNVWHAARNEAVPDGYAYKKEPLKPIESVLRSIVAANCRIEYTAIKLDTVSPGLQTAHTGILYNYFAWLMLRGPLTSHNAVELFMDRRNKETHHLLKFDGYIESKAGIHRAEKGKPPLQIAIHHYHNGSAEECKGGARALVEYGVRGLEAADFVCYAIKRKYENGDDSLYKLIEPAIKWKQVLF